MYGTYSTALTHFLNGPLLWHFMGAHNDWVDRIFCYEWVQIGAGGNARQAKKALLYLLVLREGTKNQELDSNLAIIIIFQVNNKEAMTSDATTAIREPQSGISTQIQTPPL